MEVLSWVERSPGRNKLMSTRFFLSQDFRLPRIFMGADEVTGVLVSHD